MSVNKVILLGRTGNDIQMHHFSDGKCVGNVSLATSESYKDKNGEKVEKTEWHSLVFRNKQAETVEKYVKKGDQIFVEGKLQTRTWEDKDGKTNYVKEVIVLNFSFTAKSTSTASNSEAYQQPPLEPRQEEDEIPF